MIVPTHAVADDVVNVLGIPRNRVVAIPEAAAPALHARPDAEVCAVRERFGLPDRYLLWVGGLSAPDPRKRVTALTRAARTMPLVLVGSTGPWAHELPDVHLTGRVTDDELAAIYSGAHALVFPSDDEGFGLPPVEALACGTPVAASDVPALREVLYGHAMLRSVEDVDGLIAAAESCPAPCARAAGLDVGRRRAGHVGGLRASRQRARRLAQPAPPDGCAQRLSTSSVTGPSLVSCTAISAPNTPRRAPMRSQKRSYSGSACSGGAAAT